MKYVALTIHGSYLEMTADANRVRIWATGKTTAAPTIFERIALPQHRIALRSLDGRYVSCQALADSGGAAAHGLLTADALGPAEVFDEVAWPSGEVSLRSCDGLFVTAQHGGGGRVLVDSDAAGDWQRFTYVQVPDAQIPQQLSRALGAQAHSVR